MIIFPAIDIKDGKVVRLSQGRFEYVTQYSDNPVDMAKHWEAQGAQWLHLVDLDGALTGKMKNQQIIIEMAKAVKVPIQVGGGIRSQADAETLLHNGIDRIILGTKAIEDKLFFQGLLDMWQDRIAVSLDCKNGMLAQRGWTDTTTIKATSFAKELEVMGVECLIYTDIARDGMMTGPNIPALEEMLAATDIPVIASGGIATLEDIKKLAALKDKGLMGAITGKAIYEGRLNLKEALRLC